MKRPFATIGFSMLTSFLIISELSFNTTVAVSLIAIVVLFIFLAFKNLRKNQIAIGILLSVAIFSLSFIFAQKEYEQATSGETYREITGIICETPKSSDYSHSYVIKVKGENYKIRYVSEYNRDFKQGEKVKGFVTLESNKENSDYFESALSSKVYFNCFESEKCNLSLTGEKDPICFYAGELKNWFLEVVSQYLPSENGGVAKAMSIGDKSELSENTTTAFNYSGISHLLVVSGLHLSLWSLGIIKFFQRKEKFRRFVPALGIFCMFGFALLTGISVSVIRAGLMVGLSLLAKAFRRDSDSLNSIGLAVTLILLSNPFAAYGAALWLSVFSTVGILVFYESLRKWITSFKLFESINEKWVGRIVVSSFAISISTGLATMPVFIIKFHTMPIASAITNLLTVDAALILMVLTVFGVLIHLSGLLLFSKPIFFIVGILGEYLQKIANAIGRWEYSTISVSSPLFRGFLVFAIGLIAVACILKKRNINILKTVVSMLSIGLVLVTLYTTSDYYNSLNIYVNNRLDNLVMTMTYQGDTILIGCPDKKQSREIQNALLGKNEKKIDNIFSFSQEENRLMLLEQNLFLDANCTLNNVSDEYIVREVNAGISITYRNVNLLLINNISFENCFENSIKYDIIISNMPIETEKSFLTDLLRNESSVILSVQSGETVNIDCKQEKNYVTYN